MMDNKHAVRATRERRPKRVYISGPISGTADYNERFLKAEQQIRARGMVAVNPAKIHWHLEGLDYEERMEVDMCLMSLCDAVCLTDGWQSSRGCRQEYGFALGRGMEIITQTGEDER